MRDDIGDRRGLRERGPSALLEIVTEMRLRGFRVGNDLQAVRNAVLTAFRYHDSRRMVEAIGEFLNYPPAAGRADSSFRE